LRNTSFFSSFSHGVWTIQAGGLFLLTVFSFFPVLFHLEEYLFFSLLGLALLLGWLEGKDLKIQTPIDLILVLLLAWILLTIPFSLNPEYSFVEWRKLVAQCLVFYWAVYVIREISQRQQRESPGLSFKWLEVVGGKSHPPLVFLGILVGALLLSSFTLVDFIVRGGNWQDRNIRAIVPGSDYNWLSTYLVLSIPIILYCGMISRLLWGKIFSFSTLIFALLAYAASYTRAGWLASVVQLFSWGLVTRRRFLIISLILVIILGSVLLLWISQMGYHADTLHTWTVETRLQVWKLGVDQIISHPLVGIGYGNTIFEPVLADTPMGDIPMHLHNVPLMVGVGSGIPGLMLFLWVFIRLGMELFPKKNQKNWTGSETFKLCLGIVLVGFFCRNLFDYMFAGSLAYLFWILMACGFASSVEKHVKYSGPRKLAGLLR
jgi:heptosyltransferase-3/putative inorganic carbon (HCO3(-)) transporter